MTHGSSFARFLDAIVGMYDRSDAVPDKPGRADDFIELMNNAVDATS
jgi:hypothetical protein